MSYLFHLLVGFFLFLIKTTPLARLLPFHPSYDLLMLVVIFIALFRKPQEGWVMVPLFGIGMDLFSGGTFGLFLTTYLWLYMGIRWASRYIDLTGFFLLPLVCMGGVVFESLIYFGSEIFLQVRRIDLFYILGLLGEQVVWGAILGPIMIWGLRYFSALWEVWWESVSFESVGKENI